MFAAVSASIRAARDLKSEQEQALLWCRANGNPHQGNAKSFYAAIERLAIATTLDAQTANDGEWTELLAAALDVVDRDIKES